MTIIPISVSDHVVDGVWSALQSEAQNYSEKERALSSLLYASILDQSSFCRALANHLAEKLATPEFTSLQLRKLFIEVFRADGNLVESAATDLVAVMERDPACTSHLQAFLYFKGFMALQTHRVAHSLWNEGREFLSYHLQSRSSELFGVDINPAAKFGRGIMLDHATGLVAGETSVVGDGCSILHGVTLGGTGKDNEDRHPKIGQNVLIGAGAKILGNIKIGDGARIAAGSVVLKDVPARCTVAGVPAVPVGGTCCPNPAAQMDQILGESTEN
ncbi:MAG: serine O-acetyltransferase [Robiginitomaculum sp.]|nr:MAG: serine O-acetyltransferase [Robiginitomaculum sp.]